MADECNLLWLKRTVAFRYAWNRRRAWVLYKLINKPEDELVNKPGDKLVNRSGENHGLSLLALAAYSCMNEATDDRDRLYSLTGLSTENHALIVDYSRSMDEVYLQFAQSFIVKHKSLDIISFASLFIATPNSSLPSWVPDWRIAIKPFVLPVMTSQSSTRFIRNLRPPKALDFKYNDNSTHYSASGSKPAVFSFKGLTLLTRGFIVDVINGIAGSRDAKFVQSK